METFNLRPNEIAFLNYLNGLPRANNLPDYWKYTYGINTEKTAQKFINLGLMKYEKNYEMGLMRISNLELKSILKNNSLILSGKKEILVKRILENVDINYIDKVLKEKDFYIITSKGQELLDRCEICILNVKKNYNFTDTEILKVLNLPEQYSTHDRLWNIFVDRNLKFPSQKEWYSYRLNLLCMGELLFSEDKYSLALSYYISVFMIDLSGMSQNNHVNQIDEIFIAPDIIKNIKNLINLSETNLKDVKEIIYKNNVTKCLPFQYYTSETIFKILCDCLNDIEFDYKKYPHNMPSSNSKLYDYWDYTNDDGINVDINIIEKTNTYKKKEISPLKVILGLSTCGISLLFTGIYKNKKKK